MTENERKFAEDNGLLFKKRPNPLPDVVGYYDTEFSVHPEQIRVSFEDGSTAVYDLRVNQPHPIIMENIRIIRKWKQGYVNQPPRRRRRK